MSGCEPVSPQVAGQDRIFATGDIALIEYQPLPQVAQLAIQTGRHAGRQIARLMAGQPTQPFRYHAKGIMATIGRRSAVVELPHGVQIHGTLAGCSGWGCTGSTCWAGATGFPPCSTCPTANWSGATAAARSSATTRPRPCPAGRRSYCQMPRRVPGNRPGEGCLTRTYAPTHREAQHARVPDPPVRYPARAAGGGPLVLHGCGPTTRASSWPRGREPGAPGAGSPDRAPAGPVAPGGFCRTAPALWTSCALELLGSAEGVGRSG